MQLCHSAAARRRSILRSTGGEVTTLSAGCFSRPQQFLHAGLQVGRGRRPVEGTSDSQVPSRPIPDHCGKEFDVGQAGVFEIEEQALEPLWRKVSTWRMQRQRLAGVQR